MRPQATFLTLETAETPDPRNKLTTQRGYTNVRFIHRCAEHDNVHDVVSFVDDGTHDGICYGDCCTVTVPETLWARWTGTTSALVRAVLQVRTADGKETP